MTVGFLAAHRGGSARLQLSGPHSPGRTGGKLIIIIMDNTNREQFIIAPLSPGYVSASRVARPDTIIRWWGGGCMKREGGLKGRKGRGGEVEGGRGRENRGLMRFWWGLSRRGGFKHDHLTSKMLWIPPPFPLRFSSQPGHSTAAVRLRWSTSQHTCRWCSSFVMLYSNS